MKKILEIIREKNNCYNYYIHPHIEESDGRTSFLCADFQRWVERYLKNTMVDFSYFEDKDDNENFCKRYYNFYLHFKIKQEAIDFCSLLSKQDKNIVIICLDKIIKVSK